MAQLPSTFADDVLSTQTPMPSTPQQTIPHTFADDVMTTSQPTTSGGGQTNSSTVIPVPQNPTAAPVTSSTSSQQETNPIYYMPSSDAFNTDIYSDSVKNTLQQNQEANEQKQSNLDTQTLNALRQQFPNDQALQNQTSLPPAPDTTEGSPFARADIGLSSNFSNKYAKFKQYYPTGDMREVKENGDNIIVFKPNANAPWVRLNPTSQQALSQMYDDKGNIKIGETLKLLSDAAQNNSSDALTTLALSLVGGPEVGVSLKGLGQLFKTTGQLAVRGAAAKTAIAESENARGYTTNTGSEASKGAIDGLETAAWIGAAWAGLGFGRFISGTAAGQRGLFKIQGEALDAKAALDRLKDWAKQKGAPADVLKNMNYMPQQLINWPVLNRLANQSSSWFATIRDTITSQRAFGASVLQKMVNPEALETAIPRGLKTEKTAQTAAKKTLATAVGDNNTSFVEAGQAYSKDLGDYASRSAVPVREAYQARDAIVKGAGQEVQYDPGPALAAVNDVEKGTPLPYTIPAREEETGILAPDGVTPIRRTVPPENAVEQLEPLAPEAQRIADQIKLWQNSPPRDFVDPNTGQVTTVADQIQALQRQLFDLSRPDASGAVRLDESKALKMRQGLQEMLDTPQNQIPGFQEANDKARTLARERFENLEDPLIRRGNRQDLQELITTPESSVQSLGATSGRQVTALDRLKKVMLPENYNKVIDSIRTDLISNPDTLGRKLANMNSEYIKRVFGDDPTVYTAYKNFAKNWKSISDVDIAGTAAKNQAETVENNQRAAAKFLNDLLQNGQSDVISRVGTLQRMIKLDPQSQFAGSLRSGIVQALIDDNIRTMQGKAFVSQKGLEEATLRNQRNTIDSFLTDQDKQVLNDVNTFLQWIDKRGGLGDSLVGAEKTSGLLRLAPESFMAMFEHGYISYRLTNPLSQKIFYGGKYEGDSRIIQAIQKIANGWYGALPTNVSLATKRLAALMPHTNSYTTAEQENQQNGQSTPLSQQTNQALNQRGNGSEGFNLSPAEVFERNRAFIKPGANSYITKLSPQEEQEFQQWAKQNGMKVDAPDDTTSDYDMRGFYRAMKAGDPRAKSAIDKNDGKLHQPDYWKTPYDLTFSRQSQYANQNAPEWNNKDQLVLPNGKVIFDDMAQKYFPIQEQTK